MPLAQLMTFQLVPFRRSFVCSQERGEKEKELGGRISAQDKTTVCESSAKIYSNLFLAKHGRFIKNSKLFKHLLCWDHMSFPNLCSLFLVDPI